MMSSSRHAASLLAAAALWGSIPTLPHPAERLPIEEVATTALALHQAGRAGESLPYFRRLVRELGNDWRVHNDYSAALHNAAQEGRARLGKVDPVARSSYERVQMERESLKELALAERLAPTALDSVTVIISRAQRFQTWGFPLDALREVERTRRLAPASRSVPAYVEQVLSLLRSAQGAGR